MEILVEFIIISGEKEHKRMCGSGQGKKTRRDYCLTDCTVMSNLFYVNSYFRSYWSLQDVREKRSSHSSFYLVNFLSCFIRDDDSLYDKLYIEKPFKLNELKLCEKEAGWAQIVNKILAYWDERTVWVWRRIEVNQFRNWREKDQRKNILANQRKWKGTSYSSLYESIWSQSILIIMDTF